MSSDFFKIIESHYQSKLPFVIYRKPKDDHVIALLQLDNRIHKIVDFSERGFVFAPFDNSQPGILILPDKKLQTSYFTQDLKLVDPIFEESKEEEQRYINLIKKAKEHIIKGDIKKVVISRKLVKKNIASPFLFFSTLLDSHHNAFCYLWYHPKIGMWSGASPELLIHKDGHTLQTMSLAATQSIEENKIPKWSKKEVLEQKLVTDYIVDKLSKLQLKPAISQTREIQAGALWHLKSEIKVASAAINFKTILEALHPTPAVCGIPKEEAQSFILNFENYHRKYYTGYLGEINLEEANTAQLYVNLRCIEFIDEQAHIYVGGGITEESKPESEWEETIAKSKTMLKALLNS